MQNPVQFDAEVTRLSAYNDMLNPVGGYDYWEEFYEPFLKLLQELASHTGETASSRAILHQRWNDENVTNAIIYYLRLITATYLKANASSYDPFVPDGQGIVGYCAHTVEPVNREIDHLGIIGLSNVLLKPINVILEVAYLDRSPGSSVTPYRFPEEANSPGATEVSSVAYLLFRPEHYDILYRSSPEAPTPETYQVHQVSELTNALTINATPAMSNFSDMDLSTMALIPNFGNFEPAFCAPVPSSADGTSIAAAVAAQQWLTDYDHPMQMDPASSAPPPPAVSADPTTPVTPGSSIATTCISSSSDVGSSTSVSIPLATTAAPDYHIRFSAVQRDYDEIPGQFQVQTSAFKNSVWNTAHYGNPKFHPEEWEPNEEFVDSRSSRRRKRRVS